MEQPQLLLPEGDANYSAIADYKDHRGVLDSISTTP